MATASKAHDMQFDRFCVLRLSAVLKCMVMSSLSAVCGDMMIFCPLWTDMTVKTL